MATANAAATLERADDFAADYATATLSFGDGVTEAVSVTFASLATSNNGNDGLAQIGAPITATIANDVNPVNTVTLTAAGKTYNLVVGTDITISNTNFIAGETFTLNSFVVTFPA